LGYVSTTNVTPEAQQAAISEALYRVMRERGVQGLTLRAVAAEAGCTTGLVTARFPNKRALVIHARNLMHDRTMAAVLDVEMSELDAQESLRAALRGSLFGEGFDGRVWVGFIAAAVVDDQIRAVQVASNRSFLNRVSQLLSAARPHFSSDVVEERATKLVVLMAGLAVLSTTDAAHYSLARLQGILDDALTDALS